MAGVIKKRTTNYSLFVPNFDSPNWQQALERNFDIIDASLFAVSGLGNILGLWVNGQPYKEGERVYDGDTFTLWQCEVDHVAANSGTFDEDRAARPTFWSAVSSTNVYKGLWEPNAVYNTNEFVSTEDYRYGIATGLITSLNTYDDDVAAGNFVTLIDMRPWTLEITAIKDRAVTAETNAKSSETKAKTSETNAASAEGRAKTSETNAKTSETNAKAHETGAATNAGNANTSALAAKNSETAAAGHASAASTASSAANTSKNEAAASATNAKTSETNAKSSETKAKTSETNAKTSETRAVAAESASRTSETNAKNSETRAATAASDALSADNRASGHAASASSAANTALSAEARIISLEASAKSAESGAANSASTATTKAQEAVTSSVLAERWANDPEDQAVLNAKYSAYHWAEKAKKFAEDAAAGGVSSIDFNVPEGFSVSNTGSSAVVITLSYSAGYVGYTSAEKTKLSTVEKRENHSGTQAISTITNLQDELDEKQSKLSYTPVNKSGDEGLGGFTSAGVNLGNLSGLAVELDPEEGNFFYGNNNGTFALYAPPDGYFTMSLKIVNTADAEEIMFNDFSKIVGEYVPDAGKIYRFIIDVSGDNKLLMIVEAG